MQIRKYVIALDVNSLNRKLLAGAEILVDLGLVSQVDSEIQIRSLATGIGPSVKIIILLREKCVIAVILESRLKERDRGKLRGGNVGLTLETIGSRIKEEEEKEGVVKQPEHSCI